MSGPATPRPLDARQRWMALLVLCLGVLMIVLDTTIVNVALPSIRADLGFTETSLVWVVNAYMLTFGGFLLLGGRLGDLYGQRRLFLAGIALFTVASLACGLANTQGLLVAARAVQGLGGAVVSAVALSLIMNLFSEPAERAKAMGVYGFVCASGGSIGVLLGGLLTGALGWHWIFLVNLPIGVAVHLLCVALITDDRGAAGAGRLDVAGAATITSSLMLVVYAVVDGNVAGWASVQTLVLLGSAATLFAAFITIEARVAAPLMPLGLGFLPANIVMALLSLGFSAKIVTRFGLRGPMASGLLLAAVGLALFARAPVNGVFVIDVFPGMLLLGLGAGVALNPMLLAAMSDVSERDSGLASGVVNTAFMMGGALGLAVLASLAAARTGSALAAGLASAAADNVGYQLALLVGASFAAIAAVIGAVFMRTPAPAQATRQETLHEPVR